MIFFAYNFQVQTDNCSCSSKTCPLLRYDRTISLSSVVPKNRPYNNTCPEDITMAFGFCSTPLFKFIPKQLIYTEAVIKQTIIRQNNYILRKFIITHNASFSVFVYSR